MRRHGYLALGWTALALGALGLFLPLLPTTVFVLVAAWAFARSSPRLHQWLREHPRFGETLVAWEQHRAIPRRARRIALVALATSYAITATLLGPLSVGALVALVCIVGVAVYLLRLPEMPEGGPPV